MKISCILAETDDMITGNQLHILLHWDRSQLNPVHLGDIVFITSASALGNKNDSTLIPEFNYTLMNSFTGTNHL